MACRDKRLSVASGLLAFTVLGASVWFGAASAQSTPPDKEAIRAAVISSLIAGNWIPTAADAGAEPGLPTRFQYGLANLDDDADHEVIVYLWGGGWCGSGGCRTLVLDRKECGLEVIAHVPATRPPVRLLSTSSNGWRDLSVFVAGGGINPGYDAPVHFDGATYKIDWDGPPVHAVANSQVLLVDKDGELLLKPGHTLPKRTGDAGDCPTA